jgi:uncharacterized protein (DUF58 family)
LNPDNWFLPLLGLFAMGLLLEVPSLSLISFGMGLLITIAYFWNRRILDQITYKRSLHYSKGFPGEKIDVQVSVKNSKMLPLFWLLVADLWPKAVAPIDSKKMLESHRPEAGRLANMFRLPAFGKSKLAYEISLDQRGVYKLGPARLESGDPFGLYTAKKNVKGEDSITVYPHIKEIPKIDYPSASPFGDRRVHRRLFEDPSLPIGVRDYEITDEFRRVHWPATARMGKLQSKVYQPTAERVMTICLNTATSERHWEGVYPEILEHLVEMAAAVVYQANREGFQVGLISNGSMQNSDQPYRIMPGRSREQLSFLLTALAGVTPLVGIAFPKYLLRELPNLPYGNVVTVITAVVDDLLLETLIEAKRHGRKVKLISVASAAPPSIAGISNFHLPPLDTAPQLND